MKDRINERNGKNMSGLLKNVQPAVKKETKRVVMITGAGLILMWILFAILHYTMPDKVPFDYTVILGGIGGGVIAVLNFFLMGLAVQKAASATDEGTARSIGLDWLMCRMMRRRRWVIRKNAKNRLLCAKVYGNMCRN